MGNDKSRARMKQDRKSFPDIMFIWGVIPRLQLEHPNGSWKILLEWGFNPWI